MCGQATGTKSRVERDGGLLAKAGSAGRRVMRSSQRGPTGAKPASRMAALDDFLDGHRRHG